MATTYLSRTGIGTSNNQKKWTFSGWFKKSSNGSELRLITSSDNSTYDDNIRFNSDDTITVSYRNAVVIKTNRKFRDNNGYYHIVVKVDTDQVSVNDRIILYVNGIDERVNGYSTDSLPGQGLTGYINYAQHYIGITNPSANSNHFNGIMSHVHFTDGYAYDASAFGETDSTTGEWKIKTSPSVSYGTTGFWILKDGNSVTDSSPNSNTFTVSAGTLTKTEDNPSNVFATMNPLDNYYFTGTFSNGNNTVVTNNSLKAWSTSTIGMTSGKYYYEAKNSATGGSTPTDDWNRIGITDRSATSNSDIGTTANQYVLTQYDGSKYVNGTNSTYASSWSTGDIIGCAIDLDNNKIYWHKNGQWGTGSGAWDSTTFNSSTGAVTIVAPSSTLNGFYFVGVGDAGQSVSKTWQFNFGNGYFGTSAISSAGTNASGIGIFEYDVPTGYTALSTKGLNL